MTTSPVDDILTKTSWRRHPDEDILATTSWRRHLDEDISASTSWQRPLGDSCMTSDDPPLTTIGQHLSSHGSFAMTLAKRARKNAPLTFQTSDRNSKQHWELRKTFKAIVQLFSWTPQTITRLKIDQIQGKENTIRRTTAARISLLGQDLSWPMYQQRTVKINSKIKLTRCLVFCVSNLFPWLDLGHQLAKIWHFSSPGSVYLTNLFPWLDQSSPTCKNMAQLFLRLSLFDQPVSVARSKWYFLDQMSFLSSYRNWRLACHKTNPMAGFGHEPWPELILRMQVSLQKKTAKLSPLRTKSNEWSLKGSGSLLAAIY